jgi:hypothetical protein
MLRHSLLIMAQHWCQWKIQLERRAAVASRGGMFALELQDGRIDGEFSCREEAFICLEFSARMIENTLLADCRRKHRAEVAQLVEQTIRNRQVAGSIPALGSSFYALP